MKHDLAALAARIGRDRVVYVDEHVLLICARWQDVIGELPQVDAVITDPPYSERTHSGHNHAVRGTRGLDCERRTLDYARWSHADVSALVERCSVHCAGWICALTSHDLAATWQASFRASGRVDFAPVACVISGMTVRLGGDGPSSWCVWMMASRTVAQAKWGTLPGAYWGTREVQPVPGGKPLWLMRALVRDYSREGDLILDPCAGGATTLLAARLEGRQAIGIECDPDTAALAAKRLERDDSHKQTALFKPGSLTGEQVGLF